MFRVARPEARRITPSNQKVPSACGWAARPEARRITPSNEQVPSGICGWATWIGRTRTSSSRCDWPEGEASRRREVAVPVAGSHQVMTEAGRTRGTAGAARQPNACICQSEGQHQQPARCVSHYKLYICNTYAGTIPCPPCPVSGIGTGTPRHRYTGTGTGTLYTAGATNVFSGHRCVRDFH